MDKFNKSFLRIKSAICEDINAKKKALIVEQACSINECGDAGLDINEEEDCNCGKEDCPICNCKKEKEEEAENSEENEESAGNEQALS